MIDAEGTTKKMTDIVYVQRNETGNICGVFANMQPGYAEESLSADDPAIVAFLAPPVVPQSILSEDLMKQFTTADLMAIKTGVDASIQFWGYWSALQAQKSPMVVTNERFLAGWRALITVLGATRMDEIATALGITVTP